MTTKCPVCGSEDLKEEVGGLNQVFKCKKCGYSGTLVFDDEEIEAAA